MHDVIDKDTRYIFKVDLGNGERTIKNIYYFVFDIKLNRFIKKGMTQVDFAMGLYLNQFKASVCKIVEGELHPLAEVVTYKPSNIDKVFLRVITDTRRRNSIPLLAYLRERKIIKDNIGGN